MSTERIIPRKSKSKRWADFVAREIHQRFAFEVQSRLAPNFDLKKLKDGRRTIVVWPNDRRAETLNRDTAKADYDIGIAVLERLKPDDQEDLLGDELLALVESIGDQFLGDELTSEGVTMTIAGYEHLPLYDRQLLESHQIFGAALSLQLVGSEEIPSR